MLIVLALCQCQFNFSKSKLKNGKKPLSNAEKISTTCRQPPTNSLDQKIDAHKKIKVWIMRQPLAFLPFPYWLLKIFSQ